MKRILRLLLGPKSADDLEARTTQVAAHTERALVANAQVRRDLLEIRNLEKTAREKRTK